MTKDYKITKEMLELSIYKSSLPIRFAIATNGLIVTKINDVKHLIIFNIDPTKLNKWYPCFVSHNSNCVFASNNYRDLIVEFETKAFEKGYTEECRKESIIKKVENLLNCTIKKVEFHKIDSDEWWIKYSISQEVWTVYLFENYVVEIDNITFKQNDNIALLPLKSNEKWLNTGRFNNIEIVDNLFGILKNNINIL